MGRQLGLLRLAVSSARAPDWNLRPPPSVVLLGGPTRPHAGAVSFGGAAPTRNERGRQLKRGPEKGIRTPNRNRNDPPFWFAAR
jgi:hypothetical protein